MPRLVYDGKDIPVPKEGDLILGRHRDNAFQIADGKASRRHTRVFMKDDGTVWAEDLDSANGTFINEEEIFTPKKLTDGDQIVIGKAKVGFLGDTVETAPVKDATAVHADPKDLLGTLIGGCRLTGIIGSGHHGTVYRAKQISLSREVAIKIFSPDFLKKDTEFAERFLKEARQAGRIHHHNVVKIYECGNQDGLLWYSMELVEGDTLEVLLTREGKMDPTLAFIIAEQAASALQAAHETKVIHSDVNPDTLMLSNEGKIKLLDLGIVRVLYSGRSASGKKRVMGNPWYMSPERAKGEPGDERSDIYSLGCVIYHMLIGEPPYDDDSPKAILKAQLESPIPNAVDKLPSLPKKVDELLHSMLSKNPSWRFETMDEVLTELKSVRDLVSKMPASNAVKYKGKKSSSNNPVTVGAATEAAVQAAINLDRSQERASRETQSQIKRLVFIALLIVGVLVIYQFSGMSFATLSERKNNAHRSFADPFNDDNSNQRTSRLMADIKPEMASTLTTTPIAVVDKTSERWRATQKLIDTHIARGNWGAGEIALSRFADEIKNNPKAKDYNQGISLKRNQMQLDGEAWYRKQLAALPSNDTAAGVAPRLARLGELRDVTLSNNRSDAESRYQELVTKLDQKLRLARRQARQAIEDGQLDTLPRLAKELGPWFTGTPVAGIYRQFSALTNEAVATKPLWQSQWQATREHLRAATGEQALGAGAALMLAGYVEEGKALLLGEKALKTGTLVRRREALFGREAAILSFSDLGDLQFIEMLQGDVRLVDGALSGVGKEASGVAITVPVGGATWNAGMTMVLVADKGPDKGQALISCVKADVSEFALRIEPQSLVLKVHSVNGWENMTHERPAGPLTIRLVCRNNTLQVLVNSQVASEVKDVRIPSGSQLRVEFADLEWKLDEVQVVGE